MLVILDTKLFFFLLFLMDQMLCVSKKSGTNYRGCQVKNSNSSYQTLFSEELIWSLNKVVHHLGGGGGGGVKTPKGRKQISVLVTVYYRPEQTVGQTQPSGLSNTVVQT